MRTKISGNNPRPEPAGGGEGARPRGARPGSLRAGRYEANWWRAFRPKDVGRYMTAAERFDRAGKAKGARNGPIGVIGLEVLRELLRLIDYRTGRLEPAITTLMARTKRSKDAVVRALGALRRHGFLDWIRRYVPTGTAGPGPQVHQTSNAYRLALPSAAAELLGPAGGEPPVPDDHAHARAQAQAWRDAQLASVEPGERNAFLFGAGKLADAFSRIEEAILRRARESAERSPSCQEFL